MPSLEIIKQFYKQEEWYKNHLFSYQKITCFHLRLILCPPFLEIYSHLIIISSLGQKTKYSSRNTVSPENSIWIGFSRTTISFPINQRIHESLRGFLRRKCTLYVVQSRWLRTKCHHNSVCVRESKLMEMKIQVSSSPETSAERVST